MQQLILSMTLSVSKLCCPVCLHLLGMLRRLPSDFIIRGDHSTLYPVELPVRIVAELYIYVYLLWLCLRT
jgi:hypothetical protein